MSLNRFECIGNLGKDIKLRYTDDQKPVANMSVAIHKNWNDKTTGEKKSITTWIAAVLFGKTAEVCSKYLHKGSKVYLCGELTNRCWEDQQGNNRVNVEIVVDGFNGSKVEFLDPPKQKKGG